MHRLSVPLLPQRIRWLLVAAVSGVIFIFSVVIGPAAPPDPVPFWDKQLHFVAYAVLAASLAYATARSDRELGRRFLVVFGVAMLYGIAIEVVQAPLPERYFSVGDMVANAFGALLGTAYLFVETRLPYVSIGARR